VQITRAAVSVLANSNSVPASTFSSTFTSSFPLSACFHIRTEEDRVVSDHFLKTCSQEVDVGTGVD